jgi:WhiB family transcriptional regulator, redox-sensing transcriptional regulator
MSDQSWMDKGACLGLDPDDWFPERYGSYLKTSEALRVCHTLCTVRAECLAMALEEGLQFGIFGGMRPEQREELHKERKRKKGKHTMASQMRTA